MENGIIDLTGQWQFMEYPAHVRRMRDIETGDWQDCTVPASIFTNLIESGQVNESDLLANPEKYEYVSRKGWLYQKTFDCPQDILDADRCEIVFDGLDTVSQIWINGKLIARTNNMFIRHRIDVTGRLRSENNHLMVKFNSPLEYAEKLQDRYGSITKDANGHGCRVYIRKTQCQFGWDWSPPLPGCGIFRPVRIEATDKARIGNIHIRTVQFSQDSADVRVSAQVDRAVAGEYRLEFDILAPNGSEDVSRKMEFEIHDESQSMVISINQPKLWWPAGYGSQPLYRLNARLISDTRIIDQRSELFAIRTVRLNRNKDKFGSSFTFEINDCPVYCKGANWVPPSLFAGSFTDQDYQKMLETAAAANINMLRVWAGGNYETDEFYRLCDRLGIMVWQDFMFACGYYPDRNWFVKEVKNEAQHVIRRLRNHPCLVLWCGNNEIHWLHKIGRQGKKRKFYGKNIYDTLLPQMLAELDPDRDYINSTPFGNQKQPNSPHEGTMHNWRVWSGLADSNEYLADKKDIPRFVCEFGFQALPGEETIKIFNEGIKKTSGWRAIEKHNYQENGNQRLHFYLAEHFCPPKSIDDFIFFSQLTQARAVTKYIEHLRANSDINSGVLYWQLNDAFDAVSWSSIDFCGQPKALYYYAKRAYQPVTVIPSMTFAQPNRGNRHSLSGISAAISNHSRQTFTAMLTCRLCDLRFNLIDEFKRPVSVPPGESVSTTLPKSFISPPQPEKNFVHLELEHAGKEIIENFFFYLPDKYIQWEKQKLQVSAEKIHNHKWLLHFTPETVIRDLALFSDTAAKLTDNFINLAKPKKRTIEVTTTIEHNDLLSVLKVKSVNSILAVK